MVGSTRWASNPVGLSVRTGAAPMSSASYGGSVPSGIDQVKVDATVPSPRTNSASPSHESIHPRRMASTTVLETANRSPSR